MTTASSTTILDCTLRDGGYYNNWDFEPAKAEQLIAALNQAGVDIIEVGYKSLPKQGYYGLFRYCNEKYLSFLSKYTHSAYAFMIDTAEFVQDGKVQSHLLDTIILTQSESVFSWCRLASHFKDIVLLNDFVGYFRRKGYKVAFNLMGASLLSEEQLISALNQVEKIKPEVFYIADSFGSFYPKDIQQIIRFIKKYYSGELGVHTHDNQGLAYANTMAALDEGVTYMDATVMGMGRGAGNLSTEQLLLGMSEKQTEKKLNPSVLLEIIQQYVEPLKKHYGWGYNYMYMLSGLQNIHPSYCQYLSEGNRLTVKQISGILASIPAEYRSKFNKDVLQKVMQGFLANEDSKGEDIPVFSLPEQSTVIVVARGSSVAKNIDTLTHFAKSEGLLVLECNHTKLLEDLSSRILVLFNKMRLHEYISTNANSDITILTGEKTFDLKGKNNVMSFPYKIGTFEIGKDEISIPDFEAGQFALALAGLMGVKTIYLAGFDGYETEERNKIMDEFFEIFRAKTSIELVALTPTRYRSLIQSSLYSVNI
ncbi:MAG: aldolase catalytic domain-containing protein [Flavobacteriales bacterium]